jgi:hypothetical protein
MAADVLDAVADGVEADATHVDDDGVPRMRRPTAMKV